MNKQELLNNSVIMHVSIIFYCYPGFIYLFCGDSISLFISYAKKLELYNISTDLSNKKHRY